MFQVSGLAKKNHRLEGGPRADRYKYRVTKPLDMAKNINGVNGVVKTLLIGGSITSLTTVFGAQLVV